MSDLLKKNIADIKKEDLRLWSFISNDSIVGDLLSLNYKEAVILVHDSLRQNVGGLPMGCFLLATRLTPGVAADAGSEDTSLLFLRVTGNALLSNHSDTEKHRLEAGFRAVDTPEEWDAKGKTDEFTMHELRHAGVKCSVLGTFRMETDGEKLIFGADISNFYSGQGMKVYKPMGGHLANIVNYTKPTGKLHPLAGSPVHIGHVRYSSSETKEAEKIHVNVGLEPTDLLARRTALFGMSRSGKSNTIKIIASAVFKLREQGEEKERRVGQLIFDVNGEYCNVTSQDAGCLRNVWCETKNARKDNVATYGLFKHPADPDRQILKINFMGQEPDDWANKEAVSAAMASLVAGKSVIDEILQGDSADFVKAFRNTDMGVPLGDWERGDITRYRRSVAVYRSVLVAAGFQPKHQTANIAGLFSKKMREAFSENYSDSAEILGEGQAGWGRLPSVFSDLQKFIKSGEFKKFDQDYMAEKKEKGEEPRSWADDTLKGVLSLYEYNTGPRKIRGAKEQHAPENDEDYSDKIVRDVREGKLVIVDGSIGAEAMIRYTSERIVGALFAAQTRDFVNPEVKDGEIVPPPDVVVYIEEAHNLLPKNAELTDIWPRIAKEGSKFRIGMVFSTQEPSSIMPNILKNTDNWFVAHLNNSDEVKELAKYYDFAEFVDQILRVPDTGFLRMRCLSNPYIVPVQVKEFRAKSPEVGDSAQGGGR